MNIALPQLHHSTRPAETVPEKCRVMALSWGREFDWNKYVERHREATVFHTLAWRSAVRETFGHEEYYLIALQGDRVAGVLPMFVIRGPIIGRMLVSVPYGVGGGILADDEEIAATLFDAARRIAGERRCAVIDLRSERASIANLPIIDRYVGFERELPSNSSEIAHWLPRKARAMVRNAHDKFGLTSEFSLDYLSTVWELYCRNMRRTASINYPLRFFQALATQFGDQCWVSIVKRENRPIAGLLTLLFRDRVLPYFFGCKLEARKCGAANFIYASVAERAAAEGYRVFDFGRSRRDNKGSCDFKRFHGFEPKPLAYQRYFVVAKKPIDLTPTNPAFGLVRRAWPRLPLAITRPAGSLLSHYIPG